jgi:CHAT domain-containing protein
LIARIQDELGNRRLAIFYEKQAVNAIQRERQQLKNLDVATQRGYAKKNEMPYRRLAEWLTTEGRIPEAEQVMRMLKEDEYFQYLRRDYQVAKDLLFTVSLEPDEASAAGRYDQFANKLTAIGREYGELKEERNRPEYERRPFPKQARLDELDKMLDDARVVSRRFLDDLDQKFKQKDARVAEIKSGFQSLLKDMNARRTVIVSTLVDDDRLTIFITTADSQRAHAVDIKAVEVNKLVSDFRAAVMNPKIDPRDAGKKLYDIVIAPIEKDLVGINADTIVWSLDGTLRYAPMGALWDGQHYLAERYANVLITLASQKYLEQSISDKSKWRALGVGVSKDFEGFPGLKAVPDELDCIITDPVSKTVSLHPQCQRGVINGTKLLDDRFTKESFKNALGRYAVVHVASHFSLQPGDAYRSFLLMGGGATEKERKLMVSEINQSLFSGVEILTLSACNTAVGTEKSNGLEVEGFGALAQTQGAKAVIATLWEVADSSTRDFMVKFYSLYDSPASINKAQALRQAQLALLRGGTRNAQRANTVRSSIRLDAENAPKTFTPDPNAKYSHPYYWAPFILIGNWK